MKNIILGIVVGILALGGSYFVGYNSGVTDTNLEVKAEREAWESRVHALEESHKAEVVRIREELAVENTKLQAQLDALKDANVLDQYVTIEENATLPVGFVEFHDRLVLNVPVNTFRKPPKGKYTLRDLMDVLAKNYTMCHTDQAKLANLQAIVNDFIRKQRGLGG